MNLDLSLEKYGLLRFTNGLHPCFADYAIPLASTQYAEGPWGIVCLQQIRAINYCLCHLFFRFSEESSVALIQRCKGLQSILSLKGSFGYQIKGLDVIKLHEKEFLLFDDANMGSRTTVSAGESHSLLYTSYAPSIYEKFKALFPALKQDLKKAVSTPVYFLHSPKVARHTVHDAIQAIWLDHYVQELQAKHIELRLETTLFTLLAQTYSADAPEVITPLEREKAAAAREIILSDIKKHQTPPQIAAALYCSTSWLKKAFSKVYGIGMFHFLRKTRMDHAKAMLLRGESLKAVAIEVGMKPRNFPKEFKFFFGYTVTALKKSQQ